MATRTTDCLYQENPNLLVSIIAFQYLPEKSTLSIESGHTEPFWSPLLKGQFHGFSAEGICPSTIPLDTFGQSGRTF